MFKRELKVQLVKPSKQAADSDKERRFRMTPYQINNLVQENVKVVATIVAVGYAGKKVLDTASEIALIAARSNFK